MQQETEIGDNSRKQRHETVAANRGKSVTRNIYNRCGKKEIDRSEEIEALTTVRGQLEKNKIAATAKEIANM